MATGQGKVLSLFEVASEKIANAQKLMDEAKDLLKQDLDNARQEKAAIEEITKTLNIIHFASKIKLNVGGKIYKTTLDTLRKDPDSMLCAMFSGKFDLKADEEDGAYFIVMGNCFGRFLNYNQTTVRIFETMQYPYFFLKLNFPPNFIENHQRCRGRETGIVLLLVYNR